MTQAMGSTGRRPLDGYFGAVISLAWAVEIEVTAVADGALDGLNQGSAIITSLLAEFEGLEVLHGSHDQLTRLPAAQESIVGVGVGGHGSIGGHQDLEGRGDASAGRMDVANAAVRAFQAGDAVLIEGARLRANHGALADWGQQQPKCRQVDLRHLSFRLDEDARSRHH